MTKHRVIKVTCLLVPAISAPPAMVMRNVTLAGVWKVPTNLFAHKLASTVALQAGTARGSMRVVRTLSFYACLISCVSVTHVQPISSARMGVAYGSTVNAVALRPA
tara:strand:- start:238 stop:555 length:318 start_codon:yes stop_codon:yes gene_type:complete